MKNQTLGQRLFKLGIWSMLLAFTFLAYAGKPEPQFSTDQLEKEHVLLRKEMAALEQLLEELTRDSAGQRKVKAAHFLSFFTDHLIPHAKKEDREFYAWIDKSVGGPRPFTETMRYEHILVEKSLQELQKIKVDSDQGARLFVHKADRLLGMVSMHFATEEGVLIPILKSSP